MIRVAGILFALLIAGSLTTTESGAQGSGVASSRTLLQLEDGWARALVQRDTAMFRGSEIRFARPFARYTMKEAIVHFSNGSIDAASLDKREKLLPLVHRFGEHRPVKADGTEAPAGTPAGGPLAAPPGAPLPRDPAALGISTVYQDLALADNLDVVANLYMGREETSTPLPSLSEEQMEKRAREVLKDLNVTTLQSPRLVVASLSGGQRQSVAVARSVMWSAKLVMLDEPTAALGVAQTKQVLDLIHRLKQQGHAVIVISHNLVDVFEVADRIVVLYLGRNGGDFVRKDVSREQVVAAITGLKQPAEPSAKA